MQVTITAGAKPILLDGNYLTRHADQQSDLVCSSGTSLRHRLYDMDPAAQWQGDTASDASTEQITFGLWEPGFQSSHDVDFLAVLGGNLASFDWDFSDDNGATYPGANTQAFTGLTTTYKLTSLAATVAADKMRLTARTTITANSYKQAGALIVSKALWQAPLNMSVFRQHPKRAKERTARMHDGSTRRALIYRSDASFIFNDFTVGFSGLTTSEADTLEGHLLRSDPLIFCPEPGDRPDKMYLGQVVPGTYTRDYMTLSKSGVWAISFDFEEIGGA